MRQLSTLDRLLVSANNALHTLAGGYATTSRTSPAKGLAKGLGKSDLSETERRQVAGLMRVNHCGEVCAQALYQGQALTAKLPQVRQKMEQAAVEENDHLGWCENRIAQLDSHTSWLNPLFYAGSFTLGALAGALGDKWSLGFVAETEHQVVAHLDSHLQQLPAQDEASRAILQTMREDELKHATHALQAGGAELPKPVQWVMGKMSKVMTFTTYRI